MCLNGLIPANPSSGMQIPPCLECGLAPAATHAASAFAYPLPAEPARDQHSRLKSKMAQRVIDETTRYAPNFSDIMFRHITFATLAPYHLRSMLGAPSGDFCHGLLHPI